VTLPASDPLLTAIRIRFLDCPKINSEWVRMDTEDLAKISIERFAQQLGKPDAVLFWQDQKRSFAE
jgi:hypothetical protein